VCFPTKQFLYFGTSLYSPDNCFQVCWPCCSACVTQEVRWFQGGHSQQPSVTVCSVRGRIFTVSAGYVIVRPYIGVPDAGLCFSSNRSGALDTSLNLLHSFFMTDESGNLQDVQKVSRHIPDTYCLSKKAKKWINTDQETKINVGNVQSGYRHLTLKVGRNSCVLCHRNGSPDVIVSICLAQENREMRP
jgi:hypothetical protein